jgi:acetyl-CoA carboxylase biotin carboxylase subunit
MVTGIDIVREQLRIAGGSKLSVRQGDVRIRGHAIECRINAEDPAAVPAPGCITSWVPPQGAGIRVDSHCYPGYVVPPHYDSLIAKLICAGEDRAAAVELIRRALRRFRVEGVESTIPFHLQLVTHPDFRAGRTTTRWVEQTLVAAGAER